MMKKNFIKKRLRILVCDPSYSRGVNRVPMILRIKYWQKRGLSVSLLCSTEAQRFYQSQVKQITYHTFFFKWKSREYYSAIVDFLKVNILSLPLIFKVKDRVDIIYSLSSTLDLIFIPWLIKILNKKIRWYVNVDNTVPKPQERPGSLFLKTVPYLAFLFSNFFLKKTDAIFVVPNYLQKYYEKRRIKVIKTNDYYGIEPGIFKGKISAKTPKFNALFGARLHPAKGIFDLVEIMEKIVRRRKNFTLGIMGDGAFYHKKLLKDKIGSYKLEKNMVFVGYKRGKERGDLFRNCDFFLSPSYAEGMTIAVLEAMVINKPVIAYDLPEYHDVFKKYLESGQLILFPKGDTTSVANYILSEDLLKRKFQNKLSDYKWEKVFQSEYKEFIKEN